MIYMDVKTKCNSKSIQSMLLAIGKVIIAKLIILNSVHIPHSVKFQLRMWAEVKSAG